MRPDRIIVGEVRGPESLDMLQAMNTGHDGSLSTVHCNSPRDAISRVETMVLMAGFDLPVRAIREQVSSALHLIVHTERLSDGSRKVVRITEVQRMEGDQVTLQDLFDFKRPRRQRQRQHRRRLESTGLHPTFKEQFTRRGIELPSDLFAHGMKQLATDPRRTVALAVASPAAGVGRVGRPLARSPARRVPAPRTWWSRCRRTSIRPTSPSPRTACRSTRASAPSPRTGVPL